MDKLVFYNYLFFKGSRMSILQLLVSTWGYKIEFIQKGTIEYPVNV